MSEDKKNCEGQNLKIQVTKKGWTKKSGETNFIKERVSLAVHKGGVNSKGNDQRRGSKGGHMCNIRRAANHG